MAMLSSLLNNYHSTIKHIKLSGVNKQLNMPTIQSLLVQH